MVDMDEGLKTSQRYTEPQQMPSQLTAELVKMRRDPETYAVVALGWCKLCHARKSLVLSSPTNPEAGIWCPEHGWLRFDSVGHPPTERLTQAEQADNRAALARKRGPRV